MYVLPFGLEDSVFACLTDAQEVDLDELDTEMMGNIDGLFTALVSETRDRKPRNI